MIFNRACTLSAQREEGKPRSYVPQEVSHVNTFENALSVSHHFFDQDQDMKCELNNPRVNCPMSTIQLSQSRLVVAVVLTLVVLILFSQQSHLLVVDTVLVLVNLLLMAEAAEVVEV